MRRVKWLESQDYTMETLIILEVEFKSEVEQIQGNDIKPPEELPLSSV